MSDTITVSVKDLYSLAKELVENKEDAVTFTILDAEEEPDGDICPKTLWVSAHKISEPDWDTDYDAIEEITGFE